MEKWNTERNPAEVQEVASEAGKLKMKRSGDQSEDIRPSRKKIVADAKYNHNSSEKARKKLRLWGIPVNHETKKKGESLVE